MFFHRRFIPGLAIHTYLIGDDKTRTCAVIDPSRDVDEILDVARNAKMQIAHILETHVHADFVSGAVELKHRLGGEATIHCSAMGGEDWTPRYADHAVQDGDEIRMGQLRLRAVHTPGHTPEHVVWALYDEGRSSEDAWLLFSGDCVFIGDVGRPDLLGEKARVALGEQLYHSVFERLEEFPDYTEIYPGHGAGSLCGKAIGSRNSSTLGYERRFSPALRKLDCQTWIENLLDGMPKPPPYFPRMKKINREGPPVLPETLPGTSRLSVETVDGARKKDTLLVDIRPMDEFANAHIPGSVNIAASPTLSNWAGWVLPEDVPMILVGDGNEAKVREAATQLIRIGQDAITGHLDGGFPAWQDAGRETAELPTLEVEELQKRLRLGDGLTLLDVRTAGEFGAMHIEGAIHRQLGTEADPLEGIPEEGPVAIICGSGYRSSIASSLMMRAGRHDVMNVRGGMGAWGNLKLGELCTFPSPYRRR